MFLLMGNNFTIDWVPGKHDAAVFVYDVRAQRYELALVDTSTEEGRFKLALFKAGPGFIWVWPINWHSEIVH